MMDYDDIHDDQDDWSEDFDQVEDLADAGDLTDESDAAWEWTDEEREEAAELAAALEDTEPPADEASDLNLTSDDSTTLEELEEEAAAWRENLEERVGTPYDDLDENARLGQAERQADASRDASTADTLSDAIDATLQARRATHDDSDVEIAEKLQELHGAQVPYTDAYGAELNPEDEPQAVTEEEKLLNEVSELREQIEEEAKEDAEKLDEKR